MNAEPPRTENPWESLERATVRDMVTPGYWQQVKAAKARVARRDSAAGEACEGVRADYALQAHRDRLGKLLVNTGLLAGIGAAFVGIAKLDETDPPLDCDREEGVEDTITCTLEYGHYVSFTAPVPLTFDVDGTQISYETGDQFGVMALEEGAVVFGITLGQPIPEGDFTTSFLALNGSTHLGKVPKEDLSREE